jgi:hypothetical protein
MPFSAINLRSAAHLLAHVNSDDLESFFMELPVCPKGQKACHLEVVLELQKWVKNAPIFVNQHDSCLSRRAANAPVGEKVLH